MCRYRVGLILVACAARVWRSGFRRYLDEVPDSLGSVGPLPYQHSLYAKGRMRDRAYLDIASEKTDQALRVDGHTKAGRHQSEQGQGIGRLEADIHGGAFRRKHVVEAPAISFPFGHIAQDQVFLGEVGRMDLAPPRETMISGGYEIEKICRQPDAMEVGVVERPDHIADVDLVLGQRQLLSLGAHVAQIHLHLRMEPSIVRYGERHQLRCGKGHIREAQNADLTFSDQPGVVNSLRIALQKF